MNTRDDDQILEAETRKTVQHSALYSFAIYFRMGFKILGGLVIARILGPSLYGLRNMVAVCLEYDQSSDCGTFEGMNRQVPYLRGAGKPGQVQAIFTSVFGVNMLYSLSAAAILMVTACAGAMSGWKALHVETLFFLGILLITNKLRYFHLWKLTASKRVEVISVAEMIYGFFGTAATVLMVWWLSFRGLLLGLLAADLMWLGYVLSKERRLPFGRVSLPLVGNLLKIGFPVTVTFLLLNLLKSADRLVIFTMLSEEAVGFFGLAAVMTGIMETIPFVARSVTSPRMMERLGKPEDIRSIRNLLLDPTVLIAYGVPFVIGAAFLAIHLPVLYFLENFAPSIGVTRILVFGLFFATLFELPVLACYAMNKQRTIMFRTIPAVVLNFALNISFIRLGWGIEGVAIGTGISHFLYCAAVFWYVLGRFGMAPAERLRFLGMIWFPFICALLLLPAIHTLIPAGESGENLVHDTAFTLGKFALFCLLYGAVVFRVKDHPAFRKLRAHVFARKTIGARPK